MWQRVAFLFLNPQSGVFIKLFWFVFLMGFFSEFIFFLIKTELLFFVIN